MFSRAILPIVALSGVAAVMLGAFGAHGLEAVLSEKQLKTWETAVMYHFVHTLALLVFAFIRPVQTETKWIDRAIWSLLMGTLFFSGSLYILAVTQWKLIAYFTPVGGLLFIIGWLCIACHGCFSHEGRDKV